MGRRKDDKAAWVAVLLGILAVCVFLKTEREVSLTVYFEQYPEGAVTQFFYDVGNGYAEEYASADITSNKTKIVIPKECMASMQSLRADFVNQQGQVRIKKMVLCKNGLNIAVYFAEDIAEKIVQTINLNYCMDHDTLLINNETDDGQVYFDDSFAECIKAADSIQWIELVLAALFVGLWGGLFFFRERIFCVIVRLSIHKKRMIAVLLFVSCVVWCYRKYIFGSQLFVFSGVGGDSISQTYPQLFRCAALIENGEKLLGFDFTKGYGALRGVSVVNIFHWMILFGTKNLPYLMGIGQVLKVLLSFFFFYIYLKLLNRKEISCYIGAASYALCGHMIMRQYWESYSGEVVVSAVLLAALELGISQKKKAWMPVAILLYCITLGTHHSLRAFALVVGYTIFRYLELYAFERKDFKKTVLTSIGAYMLAAVGSSVYLLQSLIQNISSERAKSGISSFAIQSIFSLENDKMLITAFIRTISERLEGEHELYYFVENIDILSGPTFYCGLLMLLFIPFSVRRLNKKRKILAGIALLTALSYIMFPNLRFVANALGGYAYKFASLWIIILMLYYGSLGIDHWLEERDRLNYCSIVFLGIILIFLSVLTFCDTDFKIDSMELIGFLVLSVFVLLLMIFRKKIRSIYIGYLLAAISLLDLFTNAAVFCDTEIAVTENELKQCYDDESIAYIKELGNSAFYRIEAKDNRSQFCNGLVQDYYGLVDYSGGTEMNDGLHRFLKSMNVARLQPEIDHYMTGLGNANELYNLVCVKYVVTEDAEIDNHYGLRMIAEADGKKIYENTNVLPLGYCYTSYIEDTELEKLDIQDRRSTLLDSCVLDSENQYKSFIEKKSQMDYEHDLKGREIPYDYNAEERKVKFDEISENKVIVLTFDMNSAANSFGTLQYGNAEGCKGTVSIGSLEENSEQSFVFTGNKLSYFICDIGDMDHIKIMVYDRDAYYQRSDQYLRDRKNNAFQCSSFSSNDIAGTVETDQDAILSFAIPYDKGWNVYVDGERTDLLRVNYGFIGTYLEPGKHDIVLEYEIPYLNISMAVSILGIAAIIVWFVYFSRRDKKMQYLQSNKGESQK